MYEQKLNLQAIMQRLRTAAGVEPSPSAELWPRIAASYLARRKRRMRRRLAGAGLAIAASLTGVVLVPAWLAHNPPTIDWQARAQALEMQIDALPMPFDAQAATAQHAEGELARLDTRLQAAYDRGAQHSELALLWQQRSELLGTLLAVRRQQFTPTQI